MHDADAPTGLFPAEGSAAVDSADQNAVGELPTDFDGQPRVDDPTVPNTGAGTETYYDRGSAEFQDPYVTSQPSLSLSANRVPLGAPVTATTDTADTWGDPVQYQVVFGDGTTASSTTGAVTHTYTTPGFYTVTGSAPLDGKTLVATSRPIQVIATQAVLNVSQTALRSVTADAGSSTDYWTVSGYSFDFGDGTAPVSSTTGLVTHTYAMPGNYTITVTMTDSNGGSASASQPFTALNNTVGACGHVVSPPPRPGFGLAPARCPVPRNARRP